MDDHISLSGLGGFRDLLDFCRRYTTLDSLLIYMIPQTATPIYKELLMKEVLMPLQKQYATPPLEVGQVRQSINDPSLTYEILYKGSSKCFVIAKDPDGKIESVMTNLWLVNNTRVSQPKIERSVAQIPDAWVNISTGGKAGSFPYSSPAKADMMAKPSRIARVNLRSGTIIWCEGKRVLAREELNMLAISEWQDKYDYDEED